MDCDATSGANRTNGTYGCEGCEEIPNANEHNGAGQKPMLLPSTVTTDSITNIVLLIERHLHARRKSAVERQDAAEKSIEVEEKHVVGKMREEARDIFNKALVSGAIAIGSAGVQMAGAGLNLQSASIDSKAAKAKDLATDAGKAAEEAAKKGSEQAVKLSNKATKLAAESNQLTLKAKELTAHAEIMKAGSQMISASAKLTDGAYDSTIKTVQSESAEHQHAAGRATRESQRAKDDAAEHGELARKTFDRLEQLLQAEVQGRIALIQRA